MTGTGTQEEVVPSLRAVLETVGAIAADLDLDVTLQRIIDAATELARARYGALGVLDESSDGLSLREFATHGISPVQRQLIGDLPTGHGILGVLIDNPEPVRIDDLSRHPLSQGFPPNHPEMKTFLGAPIRIGSRIFGNLYLTERAGGGPFTDDDVELVVAFAAAAGVIIENTRLYERLSRRRRWLEAAADVSRIVLGDRSDHRPTEVVAQRSMAAGEADSAILLLESRGGDGLRVAGTAGDPIPDPLADPRPAQVCRTGTPVLPGRGGEMLVRVRSSGRINGVLWLRWTPERMDRVHDSAVESAQDFADHIALILEVALAQDDRARLAVFEDRDRIGRDLHDLVIQRLFAVGLTLENTARIAGPGRVAERVDAAVDQLDQTIKDIRRTIFELANPERPTDLYDDVQAAVADMLPSLGFRPSVTLSGPLNTAVPDQVRPHLLAVLREALSNVGRHARATVASISLSARGPAGSAGEPAVELVVEDDGRGLACAAPGNGLPNMMARADALGGSCSLGPGANGGTRLVWRVPLR